MIENDNCGVVLTIPRGRTSDEQKIGILNWPERFPYLPEVTFRVWHDDKSIHLKYTVLEKSTKAEQAVPGGQVYFDSCVEFFVQPDLSDAYYYNLEWNAAGNLYMAVGTCRADREKVPAEYAGMVKSLSSLGGEPFSEREILHPWTLEAEVPAAAFFRHGIDSLSGRKMRVNLYKCGDGLKEPHYATWYPIDAPAPDYHRPECFVTVLFE